MNQKYMSSVSEPGNIVGLTPKEREDAETVTDLFPFRVNNYYISLIDWKDGHDPQHGIVISDFRELKPKGSADPSCEKSYHKKTGLHYKNDQTGLLPLIETRTGLSCGWFLMLPATCPIKMVGTTRGHFVTRYHHSAYPVDMRKFMIFNGNAMRDRFDNHRHLMTIEDAFLPVNIPKKRWSLSGEVSS